MNKTLKGKVDRLFALYTSPQPNAIKEHQQVISLLLDEIVRLNEGWSEANHDVLSLRMKQVALEDELRSVKDELLVERDHHE